MPPRIDPAHRSRLGVALGLCVLVLLVGIDLALDEGHVPVGLFVLGPLATATLSDPRSTALVAVLAGVGGLAVAFDDDLGSAGLWSRWTTVLLGGVLAVMLADQSRRRTEALDQVRRLEMLAATERLVDRLEAAQRVGRLGSWEHDLVSGRVVWSNGMGRLVGVDPSTVTDMATAGAFVPEDERDRLTSIYRGAMAEGGNFEYSQRMVRSDGVEILTMVTGEGVVDDDGKLIALQGITRDVTEERRAAEHLDEMRTQLAATGEVVRILQRALLPRSLPMDPRFEIAAVYQAVNERAEVGGDWYDAFVRDDGIVGLSIGDVAGHGLEAATLMGHGRLGMRSDGLTQSSPGAVLAGVDRLLFSETGGRTFATALFGRYDPATGGFCWARAGHCPPVVSGPDGIVSHETCGGPPLGAGMAPECYDEGHLDLVVGATLLLFTDGLLERRNRSYDEALERLRAVLTESVEEPLSTLVDELPGRMSDAGPLEDDCCVVAIRRLA
jgi:phosphoserine phosphatase RsbU/P